MTSNFLPWLDRAGRLSWLKLIVFVGAVPPGAVDRLELQQGWLAPKPVTEAIHAIGQWAVRFLLLSLLVSTLRRVGQWGKLIAVRRMLGLAALAYALIHLSLYVVDQKFDLVHVASEIVLRFYLTIGFVALLGLLALGVDLDRRDDPPARRQALEPAAQARLPHRGAGARPLPAAVQDRRHRAHPHGRPVLSADGTTASAEVRRRRCHPAARRVGRGAALLTAVVEAVWYRLRNGIALDQVLGANLDFDTPLRPAWWVLAAGAALLAVRLARGFWTGAPGADPRS